MKLAKILIRNKWNKNISNCPKVNLNYCFPIKMIYILKIEYSEIQM